MAPQRCALILQSSRKPPPAPTPLLMTARILTLSLLATLSTLAERIIPGENLSVTIYTHGDFRNHDEDFQMKVKLHAYRNPQAQPQVTTSIETFCNGFTKPGTPLNPAELEALLAAGDAAEKRQEFQKTVVTGDLQTRIEVVKINQSRKIFILRNNENVGIWQSEIRKVRQALLEAEAGEAWFKKILLAEKLPDPTPDARPPRANRHFLTLPIGSTTCRGFEHQVQIRNWDSIGTTYKVEHSMSLFSADGFLQNISTGFWVADLLNEVSNALKSIDAGKKFEFISPPDALVRFSVTANLVTKEADVVLHPSHFTRNRIRKGHYTNAHLKKINTLIKSCDARIKWHQAHEHLFFTNID